MNMNEIDSLLGKSIASQRIRSGITREELAQKLGLSVATIAAFEDGLRRANSKQLFEIAEILDVKISGFFDGYQDEAFSGGNINLPLSEELQALQAHYNSLSSSHRSAMYAFFVASKGV